MASKTAPPRIFGPNEGRVSDFEIRGARRVKAEALFKILKTSKKTAGGFTTTAALSRKRLAGIVRRKPEVMVKVSSFASGRRGVLKQFAYFTRKGSLQVETEKGELLMGTEAMGELAEDWFGSNHHDNASVKRDTMNLILSMPAGTEREKLRKAARAFSQEAFDGHEYFFVQHDDQAHPHLHVTVKVQGDTKRLNPRKAQLQMWRELFAEKLQEQGVEANATKRRDRGKVRKAEPQKVRNMRRRGVKPRVVMRRVEEASQDARRPVSIRSKLNAALEEKRDLALKQIKDQSEALSKSGLPEDRQLPALAEKYIREQRSQESEHRELVRIAKALERPRQKSRGVGDRDL